MYNRKSAFSIVEILLMLAIIGIIMSLLAIIVMPGAPKYKTMYYYGFNNIKKMVGEVVARRSDAMLPTDNNLFCTRLTGNINTMGGSTNCITFYSSTLSAPFGGMITSNLTSPNFTLSNGQRIYISSRAVFAATGAGYRIISMDLNGESGPNEFNKDVVPFAVFDNGEVYPLGLAAEDTEYLKTTLRVHKFDTGLKTNTFVADSGGNKILSYRQATCLAGNTSSVYTTYCNNTAPFSAAINMSNLCNPALTQDFCNMEIKRPLINMKI